MQFPFDYQSDIADCGPTCLRMIARYYGKNYSSHFINGICSLGSEGTSILDLSRAAERIGLESLAVYARYEMLQNLPLPAIALWEQHHFIVIHRCQGKRIYVADPINGYRTYTSSEFARGWQDPLKEEIQGILLLLKPAPCLRDFGS